jgi:hypothetical protein
VLPVVSLSCPVQKNFLYTSDMPLCTTVPTGLPSMTILDPRAVRSLPQEISLFNQSTWDAKTFSSVQFLLD